MSRQLGCCLISCVRSHRPPPAPPETFNREREMMQYIQLLERELVKRSVEVVGIAARLREIEAQLAEICPPDSETADSSAPSPSSFITASTSPSQPLDEPMYKRRIRDAYEYLYEKLDARKTANHLYERRALNKKEFEEIQRLSSSDLPTRASEELLNIVLSQTEDFYDCFLDTLIKTDQLYIHQWIVLEGCDPDVECTAWIRDHYVFLLDHLDSVFSGLINYLYRDQVIDAAERDDVRTERTSAKQNERLLSILGRKSSEKIQLFFNALDVTGQSHVRNEITGRQARKVTVVGLTCLGDELFVLRDKDVNQVEVYLTTSEDFTQVRQFSVKGLSKHISNDMTSCVRRRCLYISDWKNRCIHKSGLKGGVTARWGVEDQPHGVSLTPSNNLLVTCCDSRKLVELCSESGQRVRQVELQSDIVRPWHAIQLVSEQYVVSHGDKELSGVCLVDGDGQILLSYGGHDHPDLHWPCHVTTDLDNSVFVADYENRRIVQLSPGMKFHGHIEIQQWPYRLYLDQVTRHLYVGHLEGEIHVLQV